MNVLENMVSAAVLPRAERLAGWAGVFLGFLAFFVAAPPITLRSPVASVVIGLAAIVTGAIVIRQGHVRLGSGAIGSGVIGGTFGYLATLSSVSHLDVVVAWSALVGGALVYATPLTFAAIGGLFSERSGVVNIGLEGMMLMGAFFAVWGADVTGSWGLGLVVAAISGLALALVHAFFAIHLRADQIVGGTAVNFLALGITGYLFVDIYHDEGTPPACPGTPGCLHGIPNIHLGFLGGGFIGDVFGQLNLMIWLSFLLLVVSYVVVFQTPAGLRLRSVGEHPRAADTVGIPVYMTRYIGVLTSGTLAALGGAYLTLGNVHVFDQNITGGRGFIALAALIFGNWRPLGAFAAAFLFGISSALGDRLDEYFRTASQVPQIFNALPYVLTLIAVAGVIGRSVPPAAIGRPYQKQ
jgi:general nucleoside transport system permease protein